MITVNEPIECSKCRSTGRHTRGKCFACKGKGYQTPEDQRRNWAWTQYARNRALRRQYNPHR